MTSTQADASFVSPGADLFAPASYDQLSEDEIRHWLSAVGFADWRAAYHGLRRLAGDRPDFLPYLLLTLADAANPDAILVNFERLAQSVADRPALFRFLADHPRTVETLVTLFASSQFLTEILLRNPEYFERFAEHKRLAQPKSVEQFYAEAQAALDLSGLKPPGPRRRIVPRSWAGPGACVPRTARNTRGCAAGFRLETGCWRRA